MATQMQHNHESFLSGLGLPCTSQLQIMIADCCIRIIAAESGVLQSSLCSVSTKTRRVPSSAFANKVALYIIFTYSPTSSLFRDKVMIIRSKGISGHRTDALSVCFMVRMTVAKILLRCAHLWSSRSDRVREVLQQAGLY